MNKPISFLAIVGLAFGCVVVLTSLVSDYWIVLSDGSHLGLFFTCSRFNCSEINFTSSNGTSDKDSESKFKTVRGILISALIIAICGFLMALGFIIDSIRSTEVRSLMLLRASMILNIMGGIAALLGSGVFATTVFKEIQEADNAEMSYSFGLCVSGGMALIVFGFLVCVGGPRKLTVTTVHSLVVQTAVTMAHPVLDRPRIITDCMQPPPHYSPHDQFIRGVYHPPPEYTDKDPPPEYEAETLLPPPYEERENKI